ncbi:hypothetical protein CHKEEEPN_4988 [Methylorubrum podarium]|nr:hypothetical protein CHKEEEPN_4988 [Methylorubrum podarium]
MKRIASLASGLSTWLALARAVGSSVLRKVGVIRSPPLTIAATAAAAWIGATAMPWPKAMVMVLISAQRGGRIGAADSGSSVRIRSSRPIFLRKARWPGTPTPSAILAEPMLEEWVNTSGMVSTRPVAW